MVVEAGILAREDRLSRDRRDLVQRHDLAVIQIDVGEDRLPVVRVDRGALRDRGDPGEVRSGGLQPLVELLHAEADAYERRRDRDGDQPGRRDDHRHQQ